MKKVYLILGLLFAFQNGFTPTSVFEIMFNNKSEEITAQNVDDVYLFITQIDQMLKPANTAVNEYTDDLKVY